MYNGWELELSERRKIYQAIHPVYNDLYWQRLVCAFNVTAAPTATCGEVVGWFDKGEGQQLVIFKIDGSLYRPDGHIYNLSWSRDYAVMGRKPYQSYTPLAISDWQPFDQPFTVELVPKLFSIG